MKHCANCRFKFPLENLEEVYCFKHNKKELFCEICSLDIGLNGGDIHSFVGK
jgi:hypothetical protein